MVTMVSSHNQAIADADLENRPPMLDKGSYMKEIEDQGNPDGKPPVLPFKRIQEEADLTSNDKKWFKEMTSRLLDEFDRFKGMLGEFIESYYLRFSKIMNDLKRHGCLPKAIASNIKFLNLMQPEWDKYVTMVPDYDAENQSFEIQGDASHNDPTDNLTSMMLLAKEITQHYSTLTNNHFCASSNTRNQVYVQDGHVNVQSRNARNSCINTGIIAANLGNATYGQQASGNNIIVDHYARACLKPRVCDSNYFKEQMMLAKKDEEGIDMNNEENDFLLADIPDTE
ncbi:hypothetical protein Tco_0930937 [Tanacetum coccineum]